MLYIGQRVRIVGTFHPDWTHLIGTETVIIDRTENGWKPRNVSFRNDERWVLAITHEGSHIAAASANLEPILPAFDPASEEERIKETTC